MSDLLQAVRFPADLNADSERPKVVRAPVSHHKTLMDIYEYVRAAAYRKTQADVGLQHTWLIDEDDRGGFAPGKFLVVVHREWEDQGTLLVDLDCSMREGGKPGLMRIKVEGVADCLRLLEESKANFTALKAAELETRWSEPFLVYTDAALQR